MKHWVNCMCWLLGRIRLGGSFKGAGKKIASVLDFTLLLPTCICIPKCLKCWMRRGASSSSSSWLPVMKMLSSTKNTLLRSKMVPLDVVGCPSSLPFSVFVLPFLGV